MVGITQIENSRHLNRDLRAENLVRETKVLNIARLAKLLVDLFGLDDEFQKVGEREGQEIEMYLPALDGYITFTLTSDRKNFDCRVEKAKNPVSRVEINAKEKEVLKVLSKIIRSKANIFGLLNVTKLFILRKLKIRGSFSAAIRLSKCLMIGKHDVYKSNQRGLFS